MRESRCEKPEHQAVLGDRMMIKRALAFDARMPRGNALAVTAKAEGVYVKAVVEEAEGS